MNGRRRFIKSRWGAFGIGALIVVILFGIALSPTSYYIIRPGSAIELQPIVTVEGGAKHEKGTLMLTTVRMGPANVLGYIVGKLDPYTELRKEETVKSPYETDEQYNERELLDMKNSQQNAMMVAFRKAGLPVTVTEEGALVVFFVPNMPAKQYLQIGDVITKVGNVSVRNSKQLLDVLHQYKAGDTARLTLMRDGKEITASVPLKPLPVAAGEKPRAGIGIAYPDPDGPMTARDVQVPKKVEIQSENIGGPSAGLMFTLEILSQLTPGDLTKGYRIAGTGTIRQDGTVGPIGGAYHKVRAAEKMNADIFFAPNNDVMPGSKMRSNYVEAKEEAEKLGMKVKVVPVRTVDDALNYLKSIPPKA
ncbi:SepM family pheromone-processing serine protease [Aneurinibacillus uraniidurans]|uniref:SepM family pheromone-processing serine protease n=1 Tax=Aneurinibacillus uraniidurans TaxID=2966586 RepID=UPI00234AAFC3|nr:SepM family pheromone-processing serine protease [Aneurinibacillus sp. B1]WCN39048.1 SepM family pheromone-processing serine protease [Aneurinibacillus sp. B1]